MRAEAEDATCLPAFGRRWGKAIGKLEVRTLGKRDPRASGNSHEGSRFPALRPPRPHFPDCFRISGRPVEGRRPE